MKDLSACVGEDLTRRVLIHTSSALRQVSVVGIFILTKEVSDVMTGFLVNASEPFVSSSEAA